MKKSPFSSERVTIDDNLPSLQDSPFVQMKLEMAKKILGKVRYRFVVIRGRGWLFRLKPPLINHRDEKKIHC